MVNPQLYIQLLYTNFIGLICKIRLILNDVEHYETELIQSLKTRYVSLDNLVLAIHDLDWIFLKFVRKLWHRHTFLDFFLQQRMIVVFRLHLQLRKHIRQ